MIALFPLNIVLFPDGPLPLRIFETRYVDMVRRCMRESQTFGVVLIREGGEVGPAETFDVGTLAKIVDFHQLSDGLLGLSCVGGQRFRIRSRSRQADGLNLGEVDYLTVTRGSRSCWTASCRSWARSTRGSPCAWTMPRGSVTVSPKSCRFR